MQRRRVRDFAELKSMLPCPCGSGLLGAKCCLATVFLDSLMYRKYHFCECSYVVRPCLGLYCKCASLACLPPLRCKEQIGPMPERHKADCNMYPSGQ